jgi:hypothetical protein
LEEAYLYVNLSQMPDGPTTIGQFNAIVSTIRRKAGRAKFPELMQSVSAKLIEPLTFEQFMSLQKVRNCMEHRGGVVGPEDTDGAQMLRLVLPSLKVFVVSEDGEIELRHDMGPGGVRIEKDHLAEVRRSSTERTYKSGQRIDFAPADYQEITQACWMFVTDLARKLPVRSLGAIAGA